MGMTMPTTIQTRCPRRQDIELVKQSTLRAECGADATLAHRVVRPQPLEPHAIHTGLPWPAVLVSSRARRLVSRWSRAAQPLQRPDGVF